MTTESSVLRTHWRTIVVAVLGAVLAFGGSFLVEPTYQSSTRLLIHGRDTTFLSTSGQDLTQQPGVLDSNLAKTLAETYGGIASSRKIATAVVDDLDLDTPAADNDGPVAWITGGFAWIYRCGRAFVTAGFCAKVDRRTKAIDDVQRGVTAAQLGSTSGEAAGQPGSFILEVTASGNSPDRARDITNAVADELVAESAARSAAARAERVTSLESQVAAAGDEVTRRSDEIAQFKTENNITDADEQQVLSATAYEQLKADLETARADLADTSAQLDSIERSLATTPPDQTTSQEIETGRSGTQISTDGVNPAYTNLQTQRDTLRSEVAGVQARISALEKQLDGSTPTTLNGAQAQLAVLQQGLTLAQNDQSDLSQQLQDARTNLASGGAELTRIDEAAAPTYPVAPRRYLYLAMGLLLGAIAGGGLTWLSLRQPADDDDETGEYDDGDPASADDQEHASHPERNGRVRPDRERVPVSRRMADETATAPVPAAMRGEARTRTVPSAEGGASA